MGFAFGPGGPAITAPHIDSQTASLFSATRSVVFAGSRIVLVSRTGMRNVEGSRAPMSVFELLSLDAGSGKVKRRRELLAYGSLPIFGTNDGNVIAAGRSLMRLTPDLKDAGDFDDHAAGQKFGNVQNVSPDGSTLGNETSPGFSLVHTLTLKAKVLTAEPSVATSVNSKGFVTDNVHWIKDHPSDSSFVPYTDANGQHLLHHGKCGGGPQFLQEDLLLVPGCRNPIQIHTSGALVRTLALQGQFSFAGVSQNGRRFALQVASSVSSGELRAETFMIYSVASGEVLTKVQPAERVEGQSWTAFSPDGSMFVVGSPLKLTLYRLP